MEIRCSLFLLGFYVLVLLDTAVLQNPKDAQCNRFLRCPTHALCINTTHCACEDGFLTTSGKKYFSDSLESCDDINECSPPTATPFYCGRNATCINTHGGYYCNCNTGYSLPSGKTKFPNPVDCQDINECETPRFCGQNAKCINTDGSFHCICTTGYALPSGEKKFSNASMNNCQDISKLPQNPGSSEELKNLSYNLQSFITTNANWTAENKRRIGIEATELLQNLEQVAWQDALRSPVKKWILLNNSDLGLETRVISNCSQEEKYITLQAQNNSVKISCIDIISSNPQGTFTFMDSALTQN